MLPEIWGPIIWYNFHIMSYTYVNDEIRKYISFFKSMPYILPCLICTEHFREELIKSPPDKNLITRDSTIRWLNNLHNHVNARLNKKIVKLGEANRIYNDTETGITKIDHRKIILFLKIT